MTEDQSIGVYVKEIDLFEPDLFLCEPFLEGFLMDKKTGTCMEADSSESNLSSYTSPFTLSSSREDEKRSSSHNWYKLLVIDENFSELNAETKILFFEISKNVREKKTQELEKMRVAWAFLVPLASDGSLNTNKDLKLQLYKVGKNCKISHQDCSIFHLYNDHKLKKLIGSLQISVKGVVPKKCKPTETEEETKQQPVVEEKSVNEILPTVKPATKTWEWSRLPGQSCRIPNRTLRAQSLGKSGVSCLQFSRNGVHVAAAVLSQIFIHQVLTGEEVIVLNSHIGFIYELDWSLDDQFLLSVSNDCRGAVWSLAQTTPLFVLPHPSYVYCGRWFGCNERIITGGKDHLLRHWCKNADGFDLQEEIPGHSGYISSLATQDGSFVYSGDSHGCVMVRKFSEGSWTLLKQLSIPGIAQNVIDSIHIHSSRRRIILSARSRGSYLVDVVSGITLQTYKSTINTFARCISCLSPCGSFLFSFCQNGDVGVWEVNTGKLVATYDNLYPIDRLSELSGCIQYHPYEHLVGVSALGQNYPLLLLKYDLSKKDDSDRLGLRFLNKKTGREFSGGSRGSMLLSSAVMVGKGG